ncbi:hypothetical protein LOAG_03949 [Loa loa]|uniref:Uncharacterized protein n=2 Tax=Loa loa TaxID=7209 RepID=A0A1S0U343_LOALO|nr:hypothetical protein LOAG_03949 [Loa loa]EFO24537.1 hypothetical protein LOAG_03949 [Loa loa]
MRRRKSSSSQFDESSSQEKFTTLFYGFRSQLAAYIKDAHILWAPSSLAVDGMLGGIEGWKGGGSGRRTRTTLTDHHDDEDDNDNDEGDKEAEDECIDRAACRVAGSPACCSPPCSTIPAEAV